MTALLYHCIILVLYDCITVLRCSWTMVILYYCITVLLYAENTLEHTSDAVLDGLTIAISVEWLGPQAPVWFAECCNCVHWCFELCAATRNALGTRYKIEYSML